MNNMANTIKNEKAIIEQPEATNTKQASTIATQSTTILHLSYEFKQLQLIIINKQGRVGIGGK